MKYVSDKYAGKPGALIEVPKGGSFADMVALKGDKEIGDKINKIIGRLRAGWKMTNTCEASQSARMLLGGRTHRVSQHRS